MGECSPAASLWALFRRRSSRRLLLQASRCPKPCFERARLCPLVPWCTRAGLRRLAEPVPLHAGHVAGARPEPTDGHRDDASLGATRC